MIFKSFLFSSLSFSMRIINSVVVVGLYYGFLTTFSIGPSQIFFLQSWIREEGDLEDLACMNRYWFDTNNDNRFSMLRIQMYPQFI
uniref:Protein TIC 214 n=1 Tax=Triticum turgidum subsp. durum TaxID=4567 RepID=A0A097PDR3_TRITD|nr:hypothetical chloroplast RF19 [Triticum turgidum subsp. durum]AIU45519.1 hypothetical chloroplast RF19 [Triticum turgidum subsp. durum]